MKQKYRGKISRPYSDLFGVKRFDFSSLPFQHYLNRIHNVHKHTPGKDGGSTRETIIGDLYRIKGYRVVQMKPNTLNDSYHQGDHPEIPYPIKQKIQEDLEYYDLKLNDACREGIPDLLAFKIKSWIEVARHLPHIETIGYNEDEGEVSIKTSVEPEQLKNLVRDYKFVEVKRWEDSLNEHQQEWFEKYGNAVDAIVFHVDQQAEIESEETIDLEDPWVNDKGEELDA